MVPAEWNGTRMVVSDVTSMNIDTVYIDGNPHPVVNGRFHVEVEPVRNEHSVDVEVIDPVGNSRRITVTVGEGHRTYDPSLSALALLAVFSAVLLMVFLSWVYILRRIRVSSTTFMFQVAP